MTSQRRPGLPFIESDFDIFVRAPGSRFFCRLGREGFTRVPPFRIERVHDFFFVFSIVVHCDVPYVFIQVVRSFLRDRTSLFSSVNGIRITKRVHLTQLTHVNTSCLNNQANYDIDGRMLLQTVLYGVRQTLNLNLITFSAHHMSQAMKWVTFF